KEKEDAIYENLISNKLFDNSTSVDDNVLNFNALAFNAKVTQNNQYEIITEKECFKNSLIEDLSNANKYVICELTKVNHIDFEEIKNALIEKAKNNVSVRFVYDRFNNIKILKELKNAGVKVYKFSKYNTVGKVYSNLRNVIDIDGEIAYLANLNVTNEQIKSKTETTSAYLKVKGDINQCIDVAAHKDAIFASGKFIQYEKCERHSYSNRCVVQYITNSASTDMELALIKAICMAKKSVQLELSQFIPTESIISLLKFAINSNIEVRLMVPLKNYNFGKYFASRAYAKELALLGANVYLFDGYINFNAVTIDDEYVMCGSYIVDREHINTSPQNILIIKDNKAVKTFNEMFNKGIENSYRINNAKFMLLREKFFKNFV
ncbi:MAG: hypothetical protein IKY10_04365, partial [Clostridia bacterium]|nr:hypothetical protein [Clostridia bacterium]